MSVETLICDFYDARARGDRAAVRSMLADDVRWHDPYPPPHGGDLIGADTVLAQIVDAAGALTDGTTRLEPHAVAADGVLAVVLVRWSATMRGRTLRGQEAAVYRVVDGRIAEAWFHPADPEASDAFFTA
ncbi:MAG: nuclear transport factor 2 family protein [Acidobacteriota bacterium]|nr:nuclear transport factor 2 family protein [Acidobacteriota bacterium]